MAKRRYTSNLIRRNAHPPAVSRAAPLALTYCKGMYYVRFVLIAIGTAMRSMDAIANTAVPVCMNP